MVSLKITTFALLGVALASPSCVPPKAIVIAAAPAVKKEAKKDPAPLVSEPPIPALPDEGIRMPNMLDLPSDGDFRATAPVVPRNDPSSGSVFVRPPTDPPSRVKPKPTE